MILDQYPPLVRDPQGKLPSMVAEKCGHDLHALRAIGYWQSPEEPSLPDPRAFVDPSWDAAERAAVIAYLRKGKTAMVWCGHARCRFDCAPEPDADTLASWKKIGFRDDDARNIARNKFEAQLMGTSCLTDGTFIWPEGFAHYLEAHAVRPPVEFVRHVLAQAP
jgi:hypothetical protein